eukprot:359504-Chlamydomonas_euryale.AAC.5
MCGAARFPRRPSRPKEPNRRSAARFPRRPSWPKEPNRRSAARCPRRPSRPRSPTGVVQQGARGGPAGPRSPTGAVQQGSPGGPAGPSRSKPRGVAGSQGGPSGPWSPKQRGMAWRWRGAVAWLPKHAQSSFGLRRVAQCGCGAQGPQAPWELSKLSTTLPRTFRTQVPAAQPAAPQEVHGPKGPEDKRAAWTAGAAQRTQ